MYYLEGIRVIVLEGSCLAEVLSQWFKGVTHVPCDLSMPYIYTLGNPQAPTSNLNFLWFYISYIQESIQS